METKTAYFNNTPIRYYTFGKDNRDLLLNTADICKILGITERPEESDLAEQDIDLASAGVYAMNNENVKFFEWLQEEFAGYSLEVLVRPSDRSW